MTQTTNPSHYSRAPRWVVRRRGLSTNAKAVFWALLDRANADNECWPSHRRIADDLGISVSTVRRALKELADVGAVTVSQRSNEAGGNSSSLFRLHVDGPRATPGAPQKLHPPVHGRTDPLFTGEQAPCSPVSAEVVTIEVEPIEDLSRHRHAADVDPHHRSHMTPGPIVTPNGPFHAQTSLSHEPSPSTSDLNDDARRRLRSALMAVGDALAQGHAFHDAAPQAAWGDFLDALEDESQHLDYADTLIDLAEAKWTVTAVVQDAYVAGTELTKLLHTARRRDRLSIA